MLSELVLNEASSSKVCIMLGVILSAESLRADLETLISNEQPVAAKTLDSRD